ncbi:MAG: TraR/DksA family transcriptional regulator [Flavobacteriales bacterium]|nr:TraR/DksA family transcriptional regulator [Flavobacteriales bacterium]
MENEDIKGLLTEEIVKTVAIIKTYQELTKPVAPDVAIGRISRMDAINNKNVTESALRQAEDKLKKLNIVLSKNGSPDFGVCVKCKNKILVGRILIRPESLLCVHCAR